MAESTLSLDYADLKEEVGRLIYGEVSTSYTADEQAEVDRVIKSGLRQFYFPQPGPGQRQNHQWSFLRPVGTLPLVAKTFDYDLPDDFGGIDGKFTFDSSDTGYVAIPIVGEGVIRDLRMRPGSAVTGTWTYSFPKFVAVRPKKIVERGVSGQRFEAMFWPTPGASYTLSYRYHVLPDMLTDERKFPYGGMAHAETILESCLAVAERRLDHEQSVHTMMFQERLAASISHDQRSTTPEVYGYCGDQSEWTPLKRTWVDVKYNSVLYKQ